MYVTPTNIIPALLVCFIVWRFVRRIRRSVGRQTFRPGRMTFRMVFFGVITAVLAAFSPHEMRFMLALGGGLLGGVLLAVVGLQLTRFEHTSEGRFFIPNTFVGLTISLLLVGRLAYRMTLFYGMAVQPENQPPGLMRSPLTLFLFGLVAGYYIVYYAGVLYRCRQSSPVTTNA